MSEKDLRRLALKHLHLALSALDAADAPAHIGANVDLAIHQLQRILDNEKALPKQFTD